MNNFESIINSIRNTLRIEGISGLDSINHCVALITSRFLTIQKCKEFKIPLEYAFENFLKKKNSDEICDDQTAIGKFYNDDADKDCLFVHLKEKLHFSSFKFKIKSPINFVTIYKKLNGINISALEEEIDIVGGIYELHLKSGTTGSGMRDLGQYFTSRSVINYMIKLCNPKLKKNGEIETILDPSMGTGGFLTMSIKHLNKKYNNINWDINKDRIYGFDIDETVRNMSMLNALLESGKIFDKTFVNNDTLHNDYKINPTTVIEKVDIILANEPFGLKNIVYKNVCKRIKDLKIDGTKAEPLFLQLMMQSLNPKGRCAVIVPEGVLSNEAKLHKLTRKYLCEKLNLKKIILLEEGLFLNTGVKVGILYFVNDGITEEVEFCNLKLSSDGLEEEEIITVGIDEIKENDYSLFLNKYNSVEEEKLEGVEYKKVSEIFTFLPKSKRQASYGQESGNIPFYTSSRELTKYCDEPDYKEECIIFGTGGNSNVKISNLFSCSTDNFIVKVNNPNILNKYIYYWFMNNMHKIDECFHGSTIKHLSKSDLENIEIPIPTLAIQKVIVSHLDENNQKIEKLKKDIIKLQNNKILENTLRSVADSDSEEEIINNKKQKTNKNVI
jgi:type I restriction-modification system DNA methylase subunit